MKSTPKEIIVELPDAIAEAFERLANIQGMTPEQLIRRIIRREVKRRS